MNLKNIFKCIYTIHMCVCECVSIVFVQATTAINNGTNSIFTFNQNDVIPTHTHAVFERVHRAQCGQYRPNQKNEGRKRNKSNKYYRVDTDSVCACFSLLLFVLCYLHPFYLFIFYALSFTPSLFTNSKLFSAIQTFPSEGSYE